MYHHFPRALGCIRKGIIGITFIYIKFRLFQSWGRQRHVEIKPRDLASFCDLGLFPRVPNFIVDCMGIIDRSFDENEFISRAAEESSARFQRDIYIFPNDSLNALQCGALVKHFLMKLESGILADGYESFYVSDDFVGTNKVEIVKGLVRALPIPNAETLSAIMVHLISLIPKIAKKGSILKPHLPFPENIKEATESIEATFGPTLFSRLSKEDVYRMMGPTFKNEFKKYIESTPAVQTITKTVGTDIDDSSLIEEERMNEMASLPKFIIHSLLELGLNMWTNLYVQSYVETELPFYTGSDDERRWVKVEL
ncbi:hypothetical protein RF11_05660 [Thelohanellus kitauei]|uniref:Rho-GAP domain-containing protein n=1 Tax=Thelohanellus kitauei TaxID=669202 RepID=A0A0C2MD49_THEKT|nr:hypothetical protein RF11_05660 [Thelohanellus kitauei]